MGVRISSCSWFHSISIRSVLFSFVFLPPDVRAAYVCGRGTNHELPEKEKQELEGLLWEEFLDFPRESQSKLGVLGSL